jgi:hypothetical protein
MGAMLEQTEADRRAAVESMLRIRAVESPPDAEGRRTIWHRGARGAELVTEVDAEGRVARQELTLFDDLLVWERDKGFRAAAVVKEGGSPAMPASATLEPTGDVAPLLGKVAAALQTYRGEDKLIGHLRELVVKAAKGHAAFKDLGEVTREGTKLPQPPAPALPPPSSNVGLLLALGGAVLVLIALVLLLAK